LTVELNPPFHLLVNFFEPVFDPDHNSENMRRIMERFTKAGWITGTSLVTPTHSTFTFNELGKAKMDELATVFAGIVACYRKDNPAPVPPAEVLILMLRLATLLLELQPPVFDIGEAQSLYGMLAVRAAAKGMISLPGFPKPEPPAESTGPREGGGLPPARF
jgi:hypothetical protein